MSNLSYKIGNSHAVSKLHHDISGATALVPSRWVVVSDVVLGLEKAGTALWELIISI